MVIFRVTIRGRKEPMFINAFNVQDAKMKAQMILESRKMILPQHRLMPGSLRKSRRIFRGK